MRDLKGSLRGVDSRQGPEGVDPFAELADIFESELGRETWQRDPAPAVPRTSFADRAPPIAYDFDASGLDNELESAFSDALQAEMTQERPRASTKAASVAGSYENWVAPRGARTAPLIGMAPVASTPAKPRSADVPPRNDLERAIHGLSRPANPRDVIIVETQSFAPERVIDEAVVDSYTPELDDFDELIASELAVMSRHGDGPTTHRATYSDARPTYVVREAEEGVDAHAAPRVAKRSGFRRTVTMLTGSAMALALVGSVGVLVWNGMEGDTLVADGGGSMLIKADTEPYKILPKDPGGRSIPNQNKAVYDRVASPGVTTPTQAALLTDSEEPIDLPAEDAPQAYDNLPGVDLVDNEGIPQKGEERVASAATEATPEVEALQPRKVRTMVVRPDGTIVPSEPAASPAPLTANGAPALIEASSPAFPPESAPATEEPAAPADVADAAPSAPVTSPEMVPGAVMQIADPIEVAAIAPQPEPAPVAAPVAAAAPMPTGGYYVQISSQPSEAGAQSSLKSLSNKFASVIEGRSLGIQSAEIPGKGTFYRVRVAAASKEEASDLCSRLKSAGGSCFVAR